MLELVNVTLEGKQTTLSFTLNAAINGGGVDNTSDAVAVQPLASVMFTTYVPGYNELAVFQVCPVGVHT